MEEARCARSYRDEVEALRVRATRCDKLENDLVRYKQKVEDMEYLKKKITVSHNNATIKILIFSCILIKCHRI